jgi:hypothetical protein
LAIKLGELQKLGGYDHELPLDYSDIISSSNLKKETEFCCN